MAIIQLREVVVDGCAGLLQAPPPLVKLLDAFGDGLLAAIVHRKLCCDAHCVLRADRVAVNCAIHRLGDPPGEGRLDQRAVRLDKDQRRDVRITLARQALEHAMHDTQ